MLSSSESFLSQSSSYSSNLFFCSDPSESIISSERFEFANSSKGYSYDEVFKVKSNMIFKNVRFPESKNVGGSFKNTFLRDDIGLLDSECRNLQIICNSSTNEKEHSSPLGKSSAYSMDVMCPSSERSITEKIKSEKQFHYPIESQSILSDDGIFESNGDNAKFSNLNNSISKIDYLNFPEKSGSIAGKGCPLSSKMTEKETEIVPEDIISLQEEVFGSIQFSEMLVALKEMISKPIQERDMNKWINSAHPSKKSQICNKVKHFNAQRKITKNEESTQFTKSSRLAVKAQTENCGAEEQERFSLEGDSDCDSVSSEEKMMERSLELWELPSELKNHETLESRKDQMIQRWKKYEENVEEMSDEKKANDGIHCSDSECQPISEQSENEAKAKITQKLWKHIVKQELKEAQQFLLSDGVWVEKSWMKDEEEEEMWKKAKKKAYEKFKIKIMKNKLKEKQKMSFSGKLGEEELEACCNHLDVKDATDLIGGEMIIHYNDKILFGTSTLDKKNENMSEHCGKEADFQRELKIQAPESAEGSPLPTMSFSLPDQISNHLSPTSLLPSHSASLNSSSFENYKNNTLTEINDSFLNPFTSILPLGEVEISPPTTPPPPLPMTEECPSANFLAFQRFNSNYPFMEKQCSAASLSQPHTFEEKRASSFSPPPSFQSNDIFRDYHSTSIHPPLPSAPDSFSSDCLSYPVFDSLPQRNPFFKVAGSQQAPLSTSRYPLSAESFEYPKDGGKKSNNCTNNYGIAHIFQVSPSSYSTPVPINPVTVELPYSSIFKKAQNNKGDKPLSRHIMTNLSEDEVGKFKFFEILKNDLNENKNGK